MSEVNQYETVEGVKEELARRILSGELQAGARLAELRLAHEMGVGVAMVREALRSLESMQLIVSEPYRGARVRRVGLQQLQDAYLVRSALDRLAGELTAARLGGVEASNELKQLELLMLQTQSAAEVGDEKLYIERNMAFHRAIVKASGNDALLQSWDHLGLDIWVSERLRRRPVDLHFMADEHEAIVDAIRAGDAQRTGELLYRHCLNGMPNSIEAEVATPQ